MMKTILILSFYFPPCYGVKVVRTTKLCKLLPMEGWSPWVLTVDPHYYDGKTMNHYESELKNTKIFRIPYLPFWGNLTIIKLLYSLIAAGFVFLYHRKIDAVYISGSPFYPFPLTLLLTGFLKIPSVLDFRDSFSFNYGYDGRPGKGMLAVIRSFLYRTFERIGIRYASKVVFATSKLQDEYSALIPRHQDKYLTIPNGIDLDDFSNIKPIRVSKRKTIIMAGQFNIYTSNALYYLLSCIKTMPNVHFLYVGEENAIVLKAAETVNVIDQITALPFQPYINVLKLIAGSDAALLSNGLVNGMGTKIFDYIALKKPTLCLVPKNSIITEQFGGYSSIVISEAPHTYKKIKSGIEKVFSITNFEPVPLDAYTRQSAAHQLSVVLNNITMRSASK
jgi:glycosyltransferase involved in cell wall biosynthesis